MSRSERPRLEEGRDLLVRRVVSDVPTPEDLRDFAALQNFARAIDSPVSLDYWKSIPYFASFMEGYRPGERARQQLETGTATTELRSSIARLRSIDPQAVRNYEQVDYANARLRAFAAETIEKDWWKLLWVPPSMPYLAPGSVYSPFSDGSVTKRLIFSAWSSVPTSVASLLSYEAERRMVAGSGLTGNTAEARRAVSARFDYVIRDGRPAGMSTLALFWPHPALADVGDPLAVLDDDPQLMDADVARNRVDERIRSRVGTSDNAHSEAAWEAFFAWPGSWPDGVHRRSDAAAYWLAGRGGASKDTEDTDPGRALPVHAKVALEQPASPRWHEDLALLALHSPGNIAYRALARICDEIDQDLRIALWRSAARLANGIRTLFNRMDVMFLLDQLYGNAQPYWRSVLQYCADGNLQSVLDEYCFQLKLELAGSGIDADALGQIADRAIEALTLRTSRYTARTTDGQFAEDSDNGAFRSQIWRCSWRHRERSSSGGPQCVQQPVLAIRPRVDKRRAGRNRLPLVEPFRGPLEPAVESRRLRAARRPRQPLRRARGSQERRVSAWPARARVCASRAAPLAMRLRRRGRSRGTRGVLAVVDLSGRRPSRAVDCALSAKPRGCAVCAAPRLADVVSHDARSTSPGGHVGVAAAARCD